MEILSQPVDFTHYIYIYISLWRWATAASGNDLQSIFATSVKTEQDGLGKDGREVLHAMVDATPPENLSWTSVEQTTVNQQYRHPFTCHPRLGMVSITHTEAH